jgi:glycosyltransferase involved in cell wall biosynthesis
MVVISTGFHRTHLAIAAREAAVRGNLARAIVGAYPTTGVARAVRAMRAERGRAARLLEREEQIPHGLLHPLFTPELLDEAARLLRKAPQARSTSAFLSSECMSLYGSLAARELARVGRPGDVYHFRAGFGRNSIRRAKQLGVVALCDHAAVHPALSESVMSSGNAEWAAQVRSPADPVAHAILSDIQAADAIVANSHFIRDMFVGLGYPEERVHVVYLGVDEAFLAHAGTRDDDCEISPLRLMFAGRFDRAKGAHVLIAALRELNTVDWRLVIAGPVGADIRREHAAFFADRRVAALGTINRRDLARHMKAAPIFVFPSPSEGSARVVFEALACGCYVITTPNAGSIVIDGVHGAMVPPNDARRLAEAIRYAASETDRVLAIGRRNADLIPRRFTQTHYGDALATLYSRLASQGRSDPRSAHSSRLVAPKSG